MIKAVLFDAYGTLFDEGKESVPRITEDIIRRFKLRMSLEEFFGDWKTNYLNIENEIFSNRRPFKTIKEINLESLALTLERFSINSSPSEFVNKLFYLWSFPKLFPEVKDILADLKESYALGILSNTDNVTLSSAVKYTGIEVDYILTSEDAKSYKPNTDIFLRACDDLELNKYEIVYVGNSLNDIIGAKRAGLMMIYVNRKKQSLKKPFYLPDYEIESLQPVPKIIKRGEFIKGCQ